MNTYYTIKDLPIDSKQKEMVLEYLARKLWDIQLALDIQDGHCKSYDPLCIEGDTAHSYVFDLEDGGRHHTFRDYEHLEKMLMDETIRTLKFEIQQTKSAQL